MSKREEMVFNLLKMTDNDCFELLDIVLDMNKDDVIKFVMVVLETITCDINSDINSRDFQLLPISRIFLSDNYICNIIEEYNLVLDDILLRDNSNYKSYIVNNLDNIIIKN